MINSKNQGSRTPHPLSHTAATKQAANTGQLEKVLEDMKGKKDSDVATLAKPCPKIRSWGKTETPMYR